MKRILLLLLISGTALFTRAQKELSLEQSVMDQYRAFAPDQLSFFQWIPDSDCYVYLQNYRNLRKGSVKNPQDSLWMSIDQFNKSTGEQFMWFSNLRFKTPNIFRIDNGQKFYSYNLVTEKGTLLADLGENAANTVFEPTTEAIAYTEGNNVYIHTKTGQKQAVTANSDENIVSGQAIARSEFGITGGLFWSSKGNKLAFYQKDESEVHNYPLVDINAYPGELMSIKYPMAGQKSEKPRVGIYNLASGKTVFISPRGNTDDYLTNLAFTPDEKYVVIAEVNRDQNHMWLNVYDAESGTFVRTLLEETNDKWVEPEHPAFFPSGANDFIWISEKDGYNNLYHYDFNGKLITQLTSNKFVTKEILCASPDGKTIYFEATGESPLNTMLYSVTLKGKQNLITSEAGTHHNLLSPDGKYIFDQYSSHDTPSVCQLLKANGKTERVLLKSENKLAGFTLGTAEIGTIQANDGTTLYTRLIKPSNFDPAKKYPVLVYVYGGPHAQLITNSWLDGASLWMYWMAEQGYLVFTVDNRGSGERGFAFESQIHRQLGTVEIEDQLSGVDYLKSLPYVDGNRLAVHGWSFGGFMTTSLMLRKPGTFQVGVAGGPVTDWKYYEVMYGERYMDRPEQNPEGYKNNRLTEYAQNLEGDLLLIHGTVDDVVVMQHNLTLVKRFIELGIQMDFFPYPMHKHNVYGKDRVHLMEKVLTYILEHNR